MFRAQIRRIDLKAVLQKNSSLGIQIKPKKFRLRKWKITQKKTWELTKMKRLPKIIRIRKPNSKEMIDLCPLKTNTRRILKIVLVRKFHLQNS